jgi:hypothetical protein
MTGRILPSPIVTITINDNNNFFYF